MWLDWLVFCKYGFSVSALWCPLPIPTVLLGFLLPWAWGIFSSWLLQQSAAIAPYLGRGVSPHRSPSWPSTWDSSSRPSCTRAATAPWTWSWSSRPPPRPRAWGCSSRQPPLASGLGGLHVSYILKATNIGILIFPMSSLTSTLWGRVLGWVGWADPSLPLSKMHRAS